MLFSKINSSLIFLLMFNIGVNESVNILSVTALLSPSHHLLNDVLLFALAKKGYNVTILGHDPDKHHHPNYTHLVMEGVYEKMHAQYNMLDFEKLGPWGTIKLLQAWPEETCKYDFETKGLETLMEYPQEFKFDLIIWDTAAGHCLLPLVERFGNPPVIGISAFVLQPNYYRNVFQPFVPFVTKDYSDKMSFWQRLENTFWTTVFDVTHQYIYYPKQTELARQYFGSNVKPVDEVIRNMSLFFINYNFAFQYPRALPPNVIPIGGIHIQPKELPKDLKQVLDAAENGFICFSLGTNVKSAELGQERINALLHAFGRLKQLVIWKFEREILENLPENVIVRKWLPQSAIIAHPNIKLLIIHGGSLSTHEGFYHGVPMIVIPFFLDQPKHKGIVEHKKVGLSIKFDDLKNSEIIYQTITSVLEDESYALNSRRFSSLYKDQPEKPLDRALYWIDYILRYGDARHLDLATRDMGFLEITNLDLFLVVLALICGFIIVISFILYFAYKSCKGITSRRKQKLKAS